MTRECTQPYTKSTGVFRHLDHGVHNRITALSEQMREGFGGVDDTLHALQRHTASLQEEQTQSDNSRAVAAVLKHIAVAALHVAILLCARLLY